MKNILFLLLLISSLSVWCAPQTPDTLRIKSARITAYKAVQKDTCWVPGAVVERIYFVKFNRLGHKRVENILNPDGSAYKKLLYIYDKNGRIKEEMEVLVNRNLVNTYGYEYDGKGKLVTIIRGKGNREAGPTQFEVDGGLQPERKDSARLLLRSEQFPYEPKAPKTARVDYTYNAAGHWVQRIEYDEANPKFIVRRELEYAGTETDWERLQLNGRVKTVTQTSYVAVPRGPETIDRGKKQGVFFHYEFDEKGRQTVDASFSETGVPGKVKQFVYDKEGNILTESWKLADGKPENSITWSYSPEGDVRTKSLYDSKGTVVQKGLFRYDAEGNCISEIWFRLDGSKYSEFRYLYDSYGQQGEKQVLAQPVAGEEPLIAGEDYCPVKRSWNFNGRIAQECITLPNGGQLLHTYTYNTKGKLISGAEQMNDQPEVTYVYKFFNDNQGNWLKRIKFVNDVPVVYEERTYTYYE